MSINVGAIFWLYSIPTHEFIVVILFSSFLMWLSSLPYIITKSKIVFLFSWVVFEFIFTKWDLACPWLTFGNVMGNQWYLVQWYSVVGVYGGSLWIICIGILIHLIFKNKNKTSYMVILICMMTLPVISVCSLFKYENEDYGTYSVLCFIPSYDYSNFEKTKKLSKFIYDSDQKFDFILTPELFYNDIIFAELKKPTFGSFYNSIFKNNVNANIFFGADIKSNSNLFNGTVLVTNNSVLFKSKKKYVPITEYTPPLLVPIFGKSFYTKNVSDDTKLIYSETNIFPFLCHEILFSDFVVSNVKNSPFIILSTSEAFIKSSLGKKQYLNIVRLRAIETNKYLIKCSNKGISCVISPKGILTERFKEEFNTTLVPIKNKKTPYSKIGDILF